ncbi:uncharacterized protein F5891DRAFT_1188351 [Suillus fuscotomentosus]|uniref:Uncharacterized protein n=1 Tax=Suillus fuscotomentosus TaxID=1912939 RepID=A0AAD4HLC7_9AGAM|nr:uncharacterized protein F5891DRAFT_1188351 [Suillus fuscotomentosus]KAG1900853.1 hypothetical protein F5891DRAFT_1188351 [Suillus fuscotomentosus]
MNWSMSPFNQPPMMNGISTLLEKLSRPLELARITDISDRWLSAIIAMSAHGAHSDNDHLSSDQGFHPLTKKHYLGNTFEGMSMRKLIYDLCAVLDHLSGGVTLCIHHPGATAPLTDLQPQDLSASLYLNPKLLAEPLRCNQPIAEITQMFIERCALPVTQSFREACLVHGWRQEPRCSSPDVDYNALPLIPLPSSGSHSSDFNILGWPDDRLQHLTLGDNSPPYLLSPLAMRVNPDSPFEHYAKPIVTPPHSTTPIVTSARSTSKIPSKLPSTPSSTRHSVPLVSLPHSAPLTFSPRSAPLTSSPHSALASSSHSLAGSIPAPSSSMSPPASFSPSYSIPGKPLLPFGPTTHTTLENLGYNDTLHNVCREVFNSCVPDRWASELAKRGSISSESDVHQISVAMWEDWKALGDTNGK